MELVRLEDVDAMMTFRSSTSAKIIIFKTTLKGRRDPRLRYQPDCNQAQHRPQPPSAYLLLDQAAARYGHMDSSRALMIGCWRRLLYLPPLRVRAQSPVRRVSRKSSSKNEHFNPSFSRLMGESVLGPYPIKCHYPIIGFPTHHRIDGDTAIPGAVTW